MKYRKIMTAIASMTMAGVMLAGCSSNATSGTSSTDSGSAAGNSTTSSGGSESTAGSEKVSLTVWGPQEDQELIKKMCDEFAAANPEKTYTFTYGVVSEADAQKEVNKDISAAAKATASSCRNRFSTKSPHSSNGRSSMNATSRNPSSKSRRNV